MLVKKSINPYEPLTQEQMEMLKKAAALPTVFDEDSPELTQEELAKFVRCNMTEAEFNAWVDAVLRAAPEVEPEPGELEAIAEGIEDIKKNGTISHGKTIWN